MDRVIKGMQSYASAYLDDLVIYSSCWKDHVSQHIYVQLIIISRARFVLTLFSLLEEE